MEVRFRDQDGRTEVEETFEAEKESSIEMPRSGWQSILDSFKRYAEGE